LRRRQGKARGEEPAMTDCPDWWRAPRTVTVVVDNPSWILPFAETLVSALSESGDDVRLARDYDHIEDGSVAFFLGCTGIAKDHVLQRCHRNLVVHASPLPKGRGFSPLTWLTLEGKMEIPVCLLEAAGSVDAGPVVYRDEITFAGHELINEMRDVLGRKTVELCSRFMAEGVPPLGTPQTGEPTVYPRRRPKDSRLDPTRPLVEQFNLLRTVDNDAYPAYFDHMGWRYKLTIEKAGRADENS
jgi:methionyl-tRNA formyltransferase